MHPLETPIQFIKESRVAAPINATYEL